MIPAHVPPRNRLPFAMLVEQVVSRARRTGITPMGLNSGYQPSTGSPRRYRKGVGGLNSVSPNRNYPNLSPAAGVVAAGTSMA